MNTLSTLAAELDNIAHEIEHPGLARRVQDAADRLDALAREGWLPIAEADSATAYLLWLPSFGVQCGMRYDGGWMVFQHDGELVRCPTPSHFADLPPPPTGDA